MEEVEHLVVKNHEDQYSIWAADQPAPPGWVIQGMKGTKEQCLEYIRTHWTDMTPASLKRQVARY